MSLSAVSNLHLRGIECCAFSESLSQIATGSTSGGLKMIDFERLQLRSDCVLQKSSPSSLTNGESGGGNITALEFAPNCRPLLISLDTDGLICVWRVQLKERVSGSDGIQAPLLSFYVQDQQTGLLIRTCFTAIALCSLLPAKETPASSSSPSITPESKTEPIDSLVPDVQENNGTVADSSSSALTAASLMLKNDNLDEILVTADEAGYINEISLYDVWENIIKNNNDSTSGTEMEDSIAPMRKEELPVNQEKYNPKLRYEEYKYYDFSQKKVSKKNRKKLKKRNKKQKNNNEEEQEEERKQEAKEAKEGKERKEGKEGTEGNLSPLSTAEEKEKNTIVPVRRWQAHQQSIVTVVLTSTPPCILSGSEDEKVNVWSLKRLDDNEKYYQIGNSNLDLENISTHNESQVCNNHVWIQ